MSEVAPLKSLRARSRLSKQLRSAVVDGPNPESGPESSPEAGSEFDTQTINCSLDQNRIEESSDWMI